MTTFAPALHLQNDNIHTKIKAQMIIKDPGSSITHFIGMLCAIAGLFPLILKAASYGTTVSIVSMTVFMVSMILLYAASTTYHTFDISSNVNIVLKRLDHCMIPVLIAGSYTPVCLIVLHNIYSNAIKAEELTLEDEWMKEDEWEAVYQQEEKNNGKV